MGTVQHDVVIATAYRGRELDMEVNDFAVHYPKAVTFLTRSPKRGAAVNGYVTWFFGPDGSLDGWAESDLADVEREAFEKAVRGVLGVRLLRVSFGEMGLQCSELVSGVWVHAPAKGPTSTARPP